MHTNYLRNTYNNIKVYIYKKWEKGSQLELNYLGETIFESG